MGNLLGTKKSHASITKPLKKIVSDLTSYSNEQKGNIVKLEEAREKINQSIGESETEIRLSNNTAQKIAALLGDDIDEIIEDVAEEEKSSDSEDSSETE